MEHNYWIVGATWPGRNMYPNFIQNGCWELTETGLNGRGILDRFQQMAVGDRIALKSNNGRTRAEIKILAIGIITSINRAARRVDVNWILVDLDRSVPLRGCLCCLNGPFAPIVGDEIDLWVHKAFLV